MCPRGGRRGAWPWPMQIGAAGGGPPARAMEAARAGEAGAAKAEAGGGSEAGAAGEDGAARARGGSEAGASSALTLRSNGEAAGGVGGGDSSPGIGP
jgi:hypothetical protein